MGCSRHALFLMLLLVIGFTLEEASTAEARPFSLSFQQGQPNIFATLGLVCKCCDGDGDGGECTSTWSGSCSKLQCQPWKLH